MYRVKQWDANFEGAKSKTYNNKSSCQMPTKHGLGYRRLIRSKNGPAMFGAWCAMIQVLSRQAKPRKGFLTDDGTKTGVPLTPDDLEILTDIPAKIFDALLKKVASQEIDWLHVTEPTDTTRIPQATTVSPQYPLDSNSDSNSDLDLDSNSDTCGFDSFWTMYDKKRDKQKTLKLWLKLKRVDHEEIMLALPPYIKATPDKTYRKDPCTYLRNRCWEDEIIDRNQGVKNGPQPSPGKYDNIGIKCES